MVETVVVEVELVEVVVVVVVVVGVVVGVVFLGELGTRGFMGPLWRFMHAEQPFRWCREVPDAFLWGGPKMRRRQFLRGSLRRSEIVPRPLCHFRCGKLFPHAQLELVRARKRGLLRLSFELYRSQLVECRVSTQVGAVIFCEEETYLGSSAWL